VSTDDLLLRLFSSAAADLSGRSTTARQVPTEHDLVTINPALDFHEALTYHIMPQKAILILILRHGSVDAFVRLAITRDEHVHL